MDLTWDDVKTGDTVEIEYENGGTIAGVVKVHDYCVLIAGVYIPKTDPYTIKSIRKTYKIGDVGLLKSNGQAYIGIYAGDGYFYMHGIRMFKDDNEGIEVLKNVND